MGLAGHATLGIAICAAITGGTLSARQSAAPAPAKVAAPVVSRQAPAQSAGFPAGWIIPGKTNLLAGYAAFADAEGETAVFNTAGDIAARGHPFFAPLGVNGRACVSCHQPANGMSVSTASLQSIWSATKGKDPLFAMVDGANCPTLDPAREASHSLLLRRGLFRIALPWPPKRPDGSRLEPDFTLEVIKDPAGCNSDPRFGIQSADPRVSVYRRPRMVGNEKHVLVDYNKPVHPLFARDHFRFLPKGNGEAFPVEAGTGRMLNPNMMADGRFGRLEDQANGAARDHMGLSALSPRQLAEIVAYEQQVFVARSASRQAGPLDKAEGAPNLGPRLIAETPPVPGDGPRNFGFTFASWSSAEGKSDEQSLFRQSVMRGFKVFNRRFLVRDVQHINTNGLGNPQARSCAMCHVMPMTGSDSQTGWIDIGTQTQPFASADPELPLFKLTCKPGKPQHMFLGRVIYTNDPGRALITGRCDDIGAIVVPQLRGLKSRAPYFSNGSAADLREVVDFYDRRWNLRFSQHDKEDLVNFLGLL